MGDWVAHLDPADQQRARRLAGLLRRAGITDPDAWVQSEMIEGIPQVARAMFLSSLWPKQIDHFTTDLSWIKQAIEDYHRDPNGAFADAGEALERMVTAAATPDDLGRVARFVAYVTIFQLLYHLDFGSHQEIDDGPGWQLMEVDPGTGLTGREIGGLYEDLLTMDPSGRDGSPK